MFLNSEAIPIAISWSNSLHDCLLEEALGLAQKGLSPSGKPVVEGPGVVEWPARAEWLCVGWVGMESDDWANVGLGEAPPIGRKFGYVGPGGLCGTGLNVDPLAAGWSGCVGKLKPPTKVKFGRGEGSLWAPVFGVDDGGTAGELPLDAFGALGPGVGAGVGRRKASNIEGRL